MATLEDLPDDAWPAIARCLTGVDLFDLARVSRRSWQLLSQDAYWRERFTDDNEEQGERGDITTTTTTTVTALQRYVRAYSLRFQGLCKDDATADTATAAWLARGSCARVSLFDARAIREDTPFAFDTWFCLLDGGDDKHKNATMHTGGILFGAQSVPYDDNRWAYYHQQFVVVSADRKLYCSVIAERPEIASNLEINCWYNLTLFYDHQTQRVFLDGALVSTLRTALHHEWWRLGPAQVGTGCITAGEDQQFPKPRRCGWYPFNGLIDEFRMWKRGLSSEDTRALSQGRAELVRAEPDYSLKKPHHHSPSYYAPQNTRRVSCSRPKERRVELLLSRQCLSEAAGVERMSDDREPEKLSSSGKSGRCRHSVTRAFAKLRFWSKPSDTNCYMT